VWWQTPVNPALRRLREEGREFEASLGYIVRMSQKKNNNKKQSILIGQ
jgi:hypothetical protein